MRIGVAEAGNAPRRAARRGFRIGTAARGEKTKKTDEKKPSQLPKTPARIACYFSAMLSAFPGFVSGNSTNACVPDRVLARRVSSDHAIFRYGARGHASRGAWRGAEDPAPDSTAAAMLFEHVRATRFAGAALDQRAAK
nr:hypothetical protein [uncultured Amaricoccus sp.]